MLKKKKNIQWFDYISNEEVLSRAEDKDLSKTIRERRRRYIGHVEKERK